MNVVYGVSGGGRKLIALCVGTGEHVIYTASTDATKYMYSSSIVSAKTYSSFNVNTSAGRAEIPPATVFPHIDAGSGGHGHGGGGDSAGKVGGGGGVEDS